MSDEKVTKKRPSPRRSGERAKANNQQVQPAEQVEGKQSRLRTSLSPCNGLDRNPALKMLDPRAPFQGKYETLSQGGALLSTEGPRPPSLVNLSHVL
jgi:hypothetical protein